jgi:ATP-dependent Lhr-like helicase
MECIGPTTAASLAQSFGLDESEIDGALLSLENGGTILRGRFTGAAEVEWCDRRLLARIHRLTLEGLRRQIAPVPPEQFVRFLTRFHHLQPQTKMRGERGLLAVIEQLEGFSAPAGHWERFLLPSRLEEYAGHWLDGLTFTGQVVWGRSRRRELSSPVRPMKSLTRSTPITLMLHEHVGWLLAPPNENGDESSDGGLGSNARAAHEAFVRHGALFPSQLGALLQLVPAQVDDVLGELAAAGLITSDGYPALRTLLGSQTRHSSRKRRRRSQSAPPAAGRWTLLRSVLTPAIGDGERAEQWARLLLRRYGVMFRDLLANEAAAPRWGELARVYRQLEARGEIRGGRFVAEVAGEQFALPEAIPMLRATDDHNEPLILPATDPLNFTGRMGAAPRVPALTRQAIAIAHGRIQASSERLRKPHAPAGSVVGRAG